MTKAAPTGLSFADLDAQTQSERPYRFEYLLPNGDGSGVFLHVLGSQSPTVTSLTNKLTNDRRRKEAILEMQNSKARATSMEVEPIESLVEFSQRLVVARLVGWEGIRDLDYTPENALKLIKVNSAIAEQVTEKSNDLGNFMKASAAS
jgi:hypothetical protein